jgi:hypothetical protein
VTSAKLLRAYGAELSAGHRCLDSGDLKQAFRHFERAHIIGQQRTLLHVRAHIAMLRVASRSGDKREVVGQLKRIVAAALFSRIWVPKGNTGGANVSAFEPMSIPEDLERILQDTRSDQ